MEEKFIDELTGLYNRRYLNKEIKSILGKARREGKELSIVVIDLDDFKKINDSHGHNTGDRVLKDFAGFLKRTLRGSSLLFRYGGDEFIVILHDTGYENALKKVNNVIGECSNVEFSDIPITMSAGVSTLSEHGKTWRELFEFADRCLYTAKRKGRNRLGTPEGRGELLIPTKNIIGRADEKKRIKSHIEKIFQGKGMAVCIKGEIGIGKTRLVDEIIKDYSDEDVSVYKSNLTTTTRSIPYYPFREIIQQIIFKQEDLEIASLPESYRTEISKIIPDMSEIREIVREAELVVDKFRLFDGIARFFKLCSSDGPILLCMDNVNWIDEGSLDFLHYLSRVLGDLPIFIFLIIRIEESRDSKFIEKLHLMQREGFCEEIELGPLNYNEVIQMVSHITGESQKRDLSGYIYRMTGGNPYFIEEFLKTLFEENKLTWNGLEWEFEKPESSIIPNSLEGVVERRLNLSDRRVRKIMNYASVINRSFEFDFFQKLTGVKEGELFDLIDEIIDVRLLEEVDNEKYSFSQDFVREVLKKRMNSARLNSLHREVGEKMLEYYGDENAEIAGELASHFYRGGDCDRAVDYCIRAGDNARLSYANREAIQFYSWGMKCLKNLKKDKTDRSVDILFKRAEVLALEGRNKKALDDLESIIEIAEGIGRKIDVVKANNRRGEILKIMGDIDESEKILKKNIEISKRIGSKKMLAESKGLLGSVMASRGQYKKAKQLLDDAIDIYEEIDNRRGLCKSLDYLGNVYYDTGNYSESLDMYRELLEMSRIMGDKKLECNALGNIGNIYLKKNENDIAMDYYRELFKNAGELGYRRGRSVALGNMGLIYMHKGNYDEARKCYEKRLEEAREMGDRKGESIVLSHIGNILYNQGKYGEAIKYYSRQLEIARDINYRRGESIALGNMGLVFKDKGNFEKALDLLKKKMELSREIGDRKGLCNSLSNLGIVYRAKGDYSQAVECYQKQLNIAEEISNKRFECISLGNMGFLLWRKGRNEEAEEYLRKLLHISEEIDYRRGISIGNGYLGHLYRSTMKYKESEECYSRSIDIAEEMGINYYLCEFFHGQATLYFLTDRINEARKLNSEASSISSNIGRDDIKFSCEILKTKIMEKSCGEKELIKMLETLEKKTDNLKQEAEIYYRMYEVTGSMEYRNKCLDCYRELAEKTEDFLYLKRISMLERSSNN